jgi:hypothetical protein
VSAAVAFELAVVFEVLVAAEQQWDLLWAIS